MASQVGHGAWCMAVHGRCMAVHGSVWLIDARDWMVMVKEDGDVH